MKAFGHVNQIFKLYGLESNTQTKWIKILISIINITILVYNLIVWTHYFVGIKEWRFKDLILASHHIY